MFSFSAFIRAIFFLIIAGLIFYVLYWLLGALALPAPFGRVAEIILYLAAAATVIGVLMGLIGFPIFKFPGDPKDGV